MVVLLVILTFCVMLLIDHLLFRQPVMIEEGTARPAKRPRLVASIVAGFEVPDNLRYHPGHTWAVSETPDLVRVGIDDLAAKVAGKLAGISIPERGQWIRQGQKIIALHHDGREVDLVSPIEGEVVGTNDAALQDLELARKDPYGDGWLLKVHAPAADENFRNLLGGALARRWMDDAAAKLRSIVQQQTPAAALAQDGGIAMDSVIDQLQEKEWESVNRELFLN